MKNLTDMLLDAFLDFVTSSSRTAATSLTGAVIGQITIDVSRLERINIAFQHAAWTVAIIAGIMTIINLFFPLRTFYENRKNKREAARQLEDDLD